MDVKGMKSWGELNHESERFFLELNQLVDDLPAIHRLIARAKLRAWWEIQRDLTLRINQGENHLEVRIRELEERAARRPA